LEKESTRKARRRKRSLENVMYSCYICIRKKAAAVGIRGNAGNGRKKANI